eukprot:24351-Pelagomonas_calceolata.AAC.7
MEIGKPTAMRKPSPSLFMQACSFNTKTARHLKTRHGAAKALALTSCIQEATMSSSLGPPLAVLVVHKIRQSVYARHLAGPCCSARGQSLVMPQRVNPAAFPLKAVAGKLGVRLQVHGEGLAGLRLSAASASFYPSLDQ